MLHRTLLCAALVCLPAAADILTLRSGRSVEGTYLGGDARQIRMALDDRVETFPVSDVTELRFGSVEKAAAPRRAERVELMRPERAETRTGSRAESGGPSVEIPAGTAIVIRMIDDVDSERNRVGETFRASIDEPVIAGERTVIARGANVVVKLIDDKEAGRLSGKTELTLDLVSVEANGRMVDILTQEVTQASESRTAQTARRAGGLAAAGAVIGAIAGGGKGAAIGAVTGAATGGAVQVMTKGPRVRIPSEARLTFTLEQPVRL
ncbi:MAG TPA: hypothetical protein VHN20_03680 [Beijerinckiaceae bacterium]|nr:hypothetical protein [Beijerinckiaceae bacterium]